jgi:hypothetical protein
MHVWGKAKEHNAGYSEGHMPEWVANNTHAGSKGPQQAHMAGSKPITHHLQNQGGSRCMCGVRRKNTMQASQKGNMPAWVANNTHAGSKGTQQTPHGGKQADHSLPAELGGIQMHVWGRTKQILQASQRRPCQHGRPASHIRARLRTAYTSRRDASRSLTSCRIRRDPDARVG